MSEGEEINVPPPTRFDVERNEDEFRAIHGFAPRDIPWEPSAGRDTRDMRDPTVVGEDHLRTKQKRPH